MANDTIQFKRNTAARWATLNPILKDGEPGYEKATGLMKVGDGVTRWNVLPYTASSAGVSSFSALSDAASANIPVNNTPTRNAFTATNSAVANAQADATAAGVLAATHAARSDNPHATTKAQVGLALVDNTADATKPVSAAQAAYADAKVQNSMVGSATIAPAVNAVQGALDAISAGATTPVPTVWSGGIVQLDKTQGRQAGLNSITSAVALSLAGGSLVDGSWSAVWRGDGVGGHTVTYDSLVFNFVGPDALDFSSGQDNIVAFWKPASGRIIFGNRLGDLADTTAPAPSSAHVDDSNQSIVRIPYSEPLVSNGIVSGDCTVSGHTVTGVTIVGSELQIQVSVAFVNGTAAASVSVAANKLKDAAGNLCAAIASQPITNNVTLKVPNAPTSLASVGSTTTTRDLSVTAPSTDVSHDAATGYTWQYRTNAGPGSWTAGGTSSGTTKTITGLTSGVSFDFQVAATNGAGTGSFSTALTNQLQPSAVTFIDNANRANGGINANGGPSGGFTWSIIGGATAIVSNRFKGVGMQLVDCANGSGEFAITQTFNINDLSAFSYLAFGALSDGSKFYAVGFNGSGQLEYFVINGGFTSLKTSASSIFSASTDNVVGVFKTASIANPGRFNLTVTLNGVIIFFIGESADANFGTWAGFNLQTANDIADDFDARFSSGGSMSITSLGTPSAFNVTAASGVTDWASFTSSDNHRKAGGTAISVTTVADNYASPESTIGVSGTPLGFTWTGTDDAITGSPGTQVMAGKITRSGSGSGKPSFVFAVSVGTGAKKIKVYFQAYRNTAGFPTFDGKATIAARVSDGGAANVSASVAPSSDGTNTLYAYEIDVTAVRAGQVVVVSLYIPPGTDGELWYDLVTFGT